MKKYIQVYHNGRPLCGSDYTRFVTGLGQRAINNRLILLKQSIESLKAIKPFLKEGVIEYKIEKY